MGPCTIKNQLGQSKIPLVGCDELVLYDKRLLAEQLLGTVLNIEVDQSDSERKSCLLWNVSVMCGESGLWTVGKYNNHHCLLSIIDGPKL